MMCKIEAHNVFVWKRHRNQILVCMYICTGLHTALINHADNATVIEFSKQI